MRIEKLHLDCASSAPSHHGSTQQWPLLHRKDYLQGSEIPAVISPSRLVPIIATGPEPMATARLGQMVTVSPRRLAEQPLRWPMAAPCQCPEPDAGMHSKLNMPQCPAAAGGGRRIMQFTLCHLRLARFHISDWPGCRPHVSLLAVRGVGGEVRCAGKRGRTLRLKEGTFVN